ncbi:MAG: rhomboid family intramembrane serine protease [Myxococcota bacterium]|jgi:membrane associated rhomboid family serine protease
MSPQYQVNRQSMLGGRLTPAVKWLVIITTGVYLLQFAARHAGYGEQFMLLFALTPAMTAGKLFLWQPLTYLFLHATNDPMHLILNMFGLWMFGSVFEGMWGTRKFLRFYLLCGVIAGLCVVLSGFVSATAWVTPTIGQSGALYGLIAAFGVIFAEQNIYFYALIPIKAKVFVWILVGMAVLFALAGSPYSLPAHMGGLVAGWLLVTGNWKPKRIYYRYKLRRLERQRRRLNVIQGGGGDRYIN